MNTDPAPDTTLSNADAAEIREQCSMLSFMLASDADDIEGVPAEFLPIDLSFIQSRMRKASKLIVELEKRTHEYRKCLKKLDIELGNALRENAALTERLRVAEERIARVVELHDDRIGSSLKGNLPTAVVDMLTIWNEATIDDQRRALIALDADSNDDVDYSERLA